jgi:hypothetical protein
MVTRNSSWPFKRTVYPVASSTASQVITLSLRAILTGAAIDSEVANEVEDDEEILEEPVIEVLDESGKDEEAHPATMGLIRSKAMNNLFLMFMVMLLIVACG